MDKVNDAQPAVNETKAMRDRDVLFAIILMIASAAVTVYSISISLEAVKELQIKFYTAPGFFVMIVGGGLFVLGAVLLVMALRQGGDLRWMAPAGLLAIVRSRASRQTATVFLYLFLYMWLFWEKVPGLGLHVPFWLGTFLFLCAMMITFSKQKLLSIILISAVAAPLIDAAFRYLAKVPLP